MLRKHVRIWGLTVLTAALALLIGCGGRSGGTAAGETTSGAPAAPSGTPTAAAGSAQSTGGSVRADLSGSVATDGSTSMAKVIGALGEAFELANPGVTFTYNPTGSGTGIQAVLEGRCDIGLSSRELKAEEKANGLIAAPVAHDGIAVIVHPDNPVQALDMETIAKIYTGSLTNWKEIGGGDSEIVVIGREAGSGTRDGFESITKTEDACRYRQELTSTGDVISTVSGNPNAIGYASLAALSDKVRALSVDGVLPDEAAIKDGTYKLQRLFLLITKDGRALTEPAQQFRDFATSDAAADIISAAGFVPAESGSAA